MVKAYKASGALKNLLDTTKSGRLLPHVERHLMARTSSRDYTYLHPSDLAKDTWCQRAAYYQSLGFAPPSERLSMSRINVFEEGHLIHAKWQTYFKEMGVLYGDWIGPDGKKFTGVGDLTGENSYNEVSLVDRATNIRGKADGWIVGVGEECLIEIKSIGVGTLRFEAPGLLKEHENNQDKAWKAVRRPFPSHIRQGQIYLALANRMEANGLLDRPAPQEIVYVYEFKPNQEIKEFVVNYDPDASARFFSRAERVVDAVNSLTPLECSFGADLCNSCKVYT